MKRPLEVDEMKAIIDDVMQEVKRKGKIHHDDLVYFLTKNKGLPHEQADAFLQLIEADLSEQREFQEKNK